MGSSVLFSVTKEPEPSLEEKAIGPHVGLHVVSCPSPALLLRTVAAAIGSRNGNEPASERSIGPPRALKTTRWLAVGEAEVLAIYYRLGKSSDGGAGQP